MLFVILPVLIKTLVVMPYNTLIYVIIRDYSKKIVLVNQSFSVILFQLSLVQSDSNNFIIYHLPFNRFVFPQVIKRAYNIYKLLFAHMQVALCWRKRPCLLHNFAPEGGLKGQQKASKNWIQKRLRR